jgi:hypothetical protein
MRDINDEKPFGEGILAFQSNTRSTISIMAPVWSIGVIDGVRIDTHLEDTIFQACKTRIYGSGLINVTKICQLSKQIVHEVSYVTNP